ncbi:MAG: Trp biosynthesis-associated membrane protein [Actinobacteria bacterium]|nr:Trp biosynthesis-associated membrane protein [Actinomycetota bacterium]
MAEIQPAPRRSGPQRRRTALMMLASGALVLILSSSMTWAVATTAIAGASVPLDGATCLPAARAVALLSLAAIGGLLAARGALRLLIGLLVTAAGLAVLVVCVSALRDGFAEVAAAALPASVDGSAAVVIDRSVSGPLLAVIGLLAVVGGGLLTVLTYRQWPALGSRYERPVAGESTVVDNPSDPRGSADLWTALDRGEDPTT